MRATLEYFCVIWANESQQRRRMQAAGCGMQNPEGRTKDAERRATSAYE